MAENENISGVKTREEIENKMNGSGNEKGYKERVNDDIKSAKSGIQDTFKNELPKQMEEYKFKVFKSTFKRDGFDLSRVNSAKELPSELQGEYSNFKLSNEQIWAPDSPYNAIRDRAITRLVDRDKALNELYHEKNNNSQKGKLENLLDEARKTLEKTRQDIDNKNKEIEELQSKKELSKDEQEQLNKLNKEKEKLLDDESYLDGITSGDGTREVEDRDGNKQKEYDFDTIPGLSLYCAAVAPKTQDIKKIIIKDLATAMEPYAINGKDVVFSDKKIESSLGKYDKVNDRLENVSQRINNIKENFSDGRVQDSQGKQNIAENAPKNQVVNNGKNVAGNVAQEQKGEKEPTGMDYLFALGYNGSNLNAKDSKKVLDAFVNEDPKKQLKIITDKDSQEAIFNAVKKANGRMTPVFALKFNKTRNALLNMANDSMLRKSLETIGIDTKNLDKEELGKAFDEEFKKYQDERSGIEEKINSMEDGEEKKKLQVELADLDKKYSSISGANEFRDMTSKELNKIKNRIADNLDYSKTKTITGARTDSNMKTTNNNPIIENKSQSNRDLNDISYLRSGVKDKDAVLDKDINEITSGNNKQVGKEDRKQDRTQGR